MKIRTRLTLLFTLLVATLLLFFCLSIYYFSSLHRRNEFSSRLRAEAYTSVELLFGKQTISPELFKLLDRNQITVLYEEEIIIYNYLNQIVYESGTDYLDVDKALLDRVRLEKEVYFRRGQREVIGVFYTDQFNRYVVFASGIDKYGFSKQANLALILSVGWLVMVLGVAYAGHVFSYNALKPMARVVRQVNQITASRLSVRLEEGSNKDEIAQLAHTFNQMLDRLEEAFRAQRSFISHASHELRTPLTAISGQIEVALLADQPAEEYKMVLVSLHEDVKELIRLSNGLLSLAGISTDSSAVRLMPVRLDELLWQAREELLAGHPGYSVRIHLPEMPEEESGLYITAHALLLKAAFMNLMENGCKFSPHKGVSVELTRQKDIFVITFTDQGIGIPEEDLPRIFEPFYRATNARTIAGHGIGLSLTNRIVALHQGSIHIHSQPGKGTTFTILLPGNF
jgi:signal transduction histidine kinase